MRFHNPGREMIKILTMDMASMVASRISESDALVAGLHLNHDFRFDPSSVGVVGFSAQHWREVFLFFSKGNALSGVSKMTSYQKLTNPGRQYLSIG